MRHRDCPGLSPSPFANRRSHRSQNMSTRVSELGLPGWFIPTWFQGLNGEIWPSFTSRWFLVCSSSSQRADAIETVLSERSLLSQFGLKAYSIPCFIFMLVCVPNNYYIRSSPPDFLMPNPRCGRGKIPMQCITTYLGSLHSFSYSCFCVCPLRDAPPNNDRCDEGSFRTKAKRLP